MLTPEVPSTQSVPTVFLGVRFFLPAVNSLQDNAKQCLSQSTTDEQETLCLVW